MQDIVDSAAVSIKVVQVEWPEVVVRLRYEMEVGAEGHLLMEIERTIRAETGKRWQVFLERLEDRNVRRKAARKTQCSN